MELLHKVLHEVGAVAGEHVDDGNLNHGVAAGLLAHGGAGYVDEYLTGEGGVVDAHVELQTLVLGLAADAFAHEVDTVAHVADGIYALYGKDVGLVVGEVGVGLDGGGYVFELGAVFELYIDHAAMNAFTEGDGHGEGVLDTGLGAHADAVAHRHAGAEVGVAEAFGREALHEGAHDGVGAWVPSGGNDADGAGLLVELHEALAVAANLCMDVEGVNGVDAQGQDLVGIFLAGAGGSGQDGYIDVLEFADVFDYGVGGQFGGFVLVAVAAHDASHLEIFGCFEGLEGVLSDVAVTYDGCSDFLHIILRFNECLSFVGCKITQND